MGKTLRNKGGLAFHLHDDILAEWTWDIEERIDYIRRHKPPEEQELRLALIRMVPEGALPETLARAEANAAWERANAAWEEAEKAYAAWERANAAWEEAEKADAAWERANAVDIDALHRQVCHPKCPWDGATIFARGNGIEVLE